MDKNSHVLVTTTEAPAQSALSEWLAHWLNLDSRSLLVTPAVCNKFFINTKLCSSQTDLLGGWSYGCYNPKSDNGGLRALPCIFVKACNDIMELPVQSVLIG